MRAMKAGRTSSKYRERTHAFPLGASSVMLFPHIGWEEVVIGDLKSPDA